ncbi:PAS domain S-box-containing protein [Desulfobaculum xiamenense]|uniref:histidine kinase n=1 Tax=Desulfobaculum xiamenense TaxID=995050 RepID=A0A846QQ50_9BACT|nr:PAS domain S-box protein [Desulfobaculum xiamenense]NJB69110.1 PAS domain S-box-containing protein [Desulfobaculum xiamenense]
MDALDFYAAGLSKSRDCGIIFEREGQVLFVNRAYLDKRGLDEEDVLGRNILDLVEPAELDTLRGAIAHAMGTTHMAEVVLRMRTRDGSGVRQVRWQGIEILSTDERPNIIVAQGRPLHPLGHDDEGMGFTITPDGTILDVSEAICAMCGYTREEVLATNTGELYYSPEDRRTIKAMLRRGGIERGQVTLRTKTGAPLTFLFTVQPVRDASDRALVFSGYFLPLGFPQSPRLAKDFSPIVHALPDIAWVQGRDHRMVAANEAYCTAFGLAHDDIIGRSETDFLPEDLARPLIQAAIHVFQERREIVAPMAKHFTGQDRWYRVVRRPVFDDANRDVIGLVGICKDITAQVEQETTYMRELGDSDCDALIVIDSQGNIIRRSMRLLSPPVLATPDDSGQVAQDLTQIVDILHPDDLPTAQETMRKVMTLKKPASFECRVRNMRRRYTRVFIRAHFNDAFFDEPRMYVAVRDMSRTDALRAAENVLERLKSATDSATFRELAEFLNVSSASISNAKKNERIPPDWLITVGMRTGTSVDWLLTGLGQSRLVRGGGE